MKGGSGSTPAQGLGTPHGSWNHKGYWHQVGVVQPLLGRHQRQRRKGEIFLLLPSFGPLISQWKTLQNTSWHGAQAARTTFTPMPPKAHREGWGMNLKTNRPWCDPLPKGDALGIMPVLCILSPTYMSLSTRYSVWLTSSQEWLDQHPFILRDPFLENLTTQDWAAGLCFILCLPSPVEITPAQLTLLQSTSTSLPDDLTSRAGG